MCSGTHVAMYRRAGAVEVTSVAFISASTRATPDTRSGRRPMSKAVRAGVVTDAVQGLHFGGFEGVAVHDQYRRLPSVVVDQLGGHSRVDPLGAQLRPRGPRSHRGRATTGTPLRPAELPKARRPWGCAVLATPGRRTCAAPARTTVRGPRRLTREAAMSIRPPSPEPADGDRQRRPVMRICPQTRRVANDIAQSTT